MAPMLSHGIMLVLVGVSVGGVWYVMTACSYDMMVRWC